jgi:hypothetical protein
MVFVLTDQAFPPILPSKENKCVVVIRVEDGYLSEIENSFRDILAEYLRPNGILPNGSVIMVGSLSHLGARGLGGYATDLVSCITSLTAMAGTGTEVVPAVPVPISGLGGSGLIRDILDFDAWLHGSAVGPGVRFDKARGAFWDVVRETGQGSKSVHGERTLYMPASCRNPRKTSFFSPALADPLPSRVPPLSETNEKRIVNALMADLNLHFGVGVDPAPSLERGVATQETDSDSARLVVAGASHMIRLAEAMGPETVSLAYQGFRPKEPMISDLAGKLRRLDLDNRDTVILDLLSNSAFMGSDSNGLPTEAVRAKDGRYHIIGSMSVAPISCAKKILQSCSPLAEALRGTGVVLLSPVPRYIHSKCCEDPSHIENFEDQDLDGEIVDGLEGFKRVLQNWGNENELLFTVIDPTMLTDSCDLPLKSRVTDDGQPLWSVRDPVHLTEGAYQDLAAVVQRHCTGNRTSRLRQCLGFQCWD